MPVKVEIAIPARALAAGLLGIGRLPGPLRDTVRPAMNIRRRRTRGPITPLLRCGRIVQDLQKVCERRKSSGSG